MTPEGIVEAAPGRHPDDRRQPRALRRPRGLPGRAGHRPDAGRAGRARRLHGGPLPAGLRPAHRQGHRRPGAAAPPGAGAVGGRGLRLARPRGRPRGGHRRGCRHRRRGHRAHGGAGHPGRARSASPCPGRTASSRRPCCWPSASRACWPRRWWVPPGQRAGVAMQGLYRTPLADPALVGIGAGAALGAALATGLAVRPGHRGAARGRAAGGGRRLPGRGLAAAAVVYRVASASGRVVVATMLLAGLALCAFLAALTALVVAAGARPGDGQRGLLDAGLILRRGRQRRAHRGAGRSSPPSSSWPGWGPRLDALALGETEAGHLGVDVSAADGRHQPAVRAPDRRWPWRWPASSPSWRCSSRASSGRWLGRSHRLVAIGSALLGATLLVLADVLARSLFSPVELSIGRHHHAGRGALLPLAAAARPGPAGAMTYAARASSVRVGAATLLADVSVEVAPGEIVAVAGPNGAGKSTLIADPGRRPTTGAGAA